MDIECKEVSKVPEQCICTTNVLLHSRLCIFPSFYTSVAKNAFIQYSVCRSQWPRGLRRRSSAARLMRSWVRIPPVAWMFVCCVLCVVSNKTMRKQSKIKRSNRWTTPEATISIAKIKSE